MGVTFICSAEMHDLEPIHGVAGRRRPLRPRRRVLRTTSQTARVAPRGPPTLCCAIMLQGRKSGFRGSRGRRASQGVRPSQSLPGPKASSQGIAPQGFSGHKVSLLGSFSQSPPRSFKGSRGRPRRRRPRPRRRRRRRSGFAGVQACREYRLEPPKPKTLTPLCVMLAWRTLW
jgi:hypothetical protein